VTKPHVLRQREGDGVARRVSEKSDVSAVERAQDALDRAQENLKRWQYQREQRRLDLKSAEDSLGKSVLRNVDPNERVNKETTGDAVAAAGQRIASLRAELEAASAAAAESEKQLQEAQRNVLQAQADELRDQAENLRREAQTRMERTDKLLAELAEHEDCEYIAKPPPSADELAMAGAGGVVVTLPKTQRLLNEAQSLELQAETLEVQTKPPVDRTAQRRKAHEDWRRWEAEESKRQERKELQDQGRYLEVL
jgi:hypothetical protein